MATIIENLFVELIAEYRRGLFPPQACLIPIKEESGKQERLCVCKDMVTE